MCQRNTSRIFLFALAIAVLGNSMIAQIASGGQFSVSQASIAGGGSTNSNAGTFSLGGTAGQAVAGQKASGGPLTDHAGFWIPEQTVVTAERVTVSGRVLRESGAGVSNIRITMTAMDGSLRSTLTNTFGYFHFDGVELGQTYIFTATSKKYTFQQTMLMRGFVAEADDLIFIVLN